MEWNSHLYVLHGLIYLWITNYHPDTGKSTSPVIHKFLLWDTRYSDSRREIVFNREIDDPKGIEGFLFVEAKPQ